MPRDRSNKVLCGRCNERGRTNNYITRLNNITSIFLCIETRNLSEFVLFLVCNAISQIQVRATARSCYRMFIKTWPERSRRLFMSFDPAIQRVCGFTSLHAFSDHYI